MEPNPSQGKLKTTGRLTFGWCLLQITHSRLHHGDTWILLPASPLFSVSWSPPPTWSETSQWRPVHSESKSYWSSHRLFSSVTDIIKHSSAGSRHTRSHPWQGHEEKAWQAGGSGFQGFWKAAPVLTFKMISVFLMPASIDYSLISMTQAEGLPRSLPK